MDTSLMDPRRYTITHVLRHPQDGYWTAAVERDGITTVVDRKHGSWQGMDEDNNRKFVSLFVAELLQARVKAVEKAEQKVLQAAAQLEENNAGMSPQELEEEAYRRMAMSLSK